MCTWGELLEIHMGKFLSQISGQYFSGLFKDWDRIFPSHFKDCWILPSQRLKLLLKYFQKSSAHRASLFIFPLPAVQDSDFFLYLLFIFFLFQLKNGFHALLSIPPTSFWGFQIVFIIRNEIFQDFNFFEVQYDHQALLFFRVKFFRKN